MGRLVWALPTECLCPPSHQPLAHHLLKPTPHFRPGGWSCEVTPTSAAPTRAPPQGAQPTASVALPEKLGRAHRRSPRPLPFPGSSPGNPTVGATTNASALVLLWTPHPPHPPRTLSPTSPGEHAPPPRALRVSQELPEDRDGTATLLGLPGPGRALSFGSAVSARR